MHRLVTETYDCTTCGACCFGARDYVQVFPHDAQALGPERTDQLVAPPVGESPASMGRPPEPQQFMKMNDGHCIALRKTILRQTFLMTATYL